MNVIEDQQKGATHIAGWQPAIMELPYLLQMLKKKNY